jgi:hypothetical protein
MKTLLQIPIIVRRCSMFREELRTLAQTFGPLLPAFSRSVASRTFALREYIKVRDWKSVAVTAHILCGCSAAYGVHSLARSAEILGQIARSNRPNSIALISELSTLGRMSDEIERLTAELLEKPNVTTAPPRVERA